ncbi:substrate-binding periplasmic protein [Thalassotalea euphylliae]|uniref:substrate-binding periplasmic protein n=1 Tax=Thalassotalea euphylliae TaxID=1655234 RepID=UPI00362823F5
MKIVVALFALFSCLLKAETLTFVAEDLPPYHYIDESGKANGALVEIVNALAMHADIEYTIELYPFARAFKLLNAKPNVLMFSLLKSPSRENQFLWLGELIHNKAFLVALKENNAELANLAQAKNSTVGTIRGYYSERYLKNAGFEEGKNLSLSVKYQSLWQMLFNKRTDFVLTNAVSLNKELGELGYSVDEIERRLELRDFPNQLHLAGNLALDPSIANKLKQALDSIKANGEYHQILTRWGLD